MNNDLISRNALIQHAYSAVVDGVEKDIIDLSDVDNAPTVELDESVIQEVLNKRCMTAVTDEYLIALHGKRPQGKWIYHTDGYIAFYTCNRCNSFGDKDDKFCGNCGADMRGAE